jgi:hypothetical protein
MTTTNVSTAVKIVVSMVVVTALVATRFSSKVRRYRRKDKMCSLLKRPIVCHLFVLRKLLRD